jgi:hypothetical protein
MSEQFTIPNRFCPLRVSNESWSFMIVPQREKPSIEKRFYCSNKRNQSGYCSSDKFPLLKDLKKNEESK